jgi:hypothetical protein
VLLEIGEDAGRCWVKLQGGELGLELCRLPQVVRVEERHELAAAGGDACIACGGDPGVRTGQIMQTRVGQTTDALRGVIGGAVVDDDDFEIAKCLAERTGDRLSFAKTLSARLIDLRNVWGLETLETATGPQSASPGAGLADKISEDPGRPAER